MLLNHVVKVGAAVAGSRSRLQKVGRLSELVRDLSPADAGVAVAYLTGRLPQGRIGLGPALLNAVRANPRASRPTLALEQVNAVFGRIAVVRGAGAQAGRQRLLGELFSAATPAEQDFLHRLVLGELRQGALEGLMLEALARAHRVRVEAVRHAVMVSGDIAAVARILADVGVAGLDRFRLTLFRPLQPMLAQTAEAPEDAVRRLGTTALEFKLDGVRVQVHKAGDEVRVFTRHLREVTAAVPEIVELVRGLPAESVILDGEALALDADGRPRPFQTTMRRFGRRLDVDALRRELPLSVFFFDCLHRDGEELVQMPAALRYASLAGLVPPERRARRKVTADAAVAGDFMAQALEQGHEGLVAKSLESLYEAGSRGAGWLKIKQVHTLDLVVLAAEWGSGRRRGWLSNLHLGARDPAGGGFVMLGKTFKGLTDAMLDWQTQQLLTRETGREEHIVHVRPELVVEVGFDGLQRSPRYPGGLALRFARVRRYRADKTADAADTLGTVRAIHEAQRTAG
jgi:DNA ligase-1